MITAHALLFDMDGLMVDSEPLWFEVERDFARSRGGEWTPELAHACIGRGLVNTLRTMRESFGFDVDFGRDGAEVIDRFIARVSDLALKPGCIELVDAAMKVIPIAVASSSSRRLVGAVLERFGLDGTFGTIVTGDDVTQPKPSPEIFLTAASRLGVEPSRCVVLEDSLAGATAGRAAGMRVIAVPEQPTPGLEGTADLIVTDLFAARLELAFARA